MKEMVFYKIVYHIQISPLLLTLLYSWILQYFHVWLGIAKTFAELFDLAPIQQACFLLFVVALLGFSLFLCF